MPPKLLAGLRFPSLPALGLALLVAGCDTAPGPEQSWELAAVGLYSAALADDGRLVLAGSINHGGSLWSLPDGERLYDWNHRSSEASNIIAAAFSPEADFAFSADHQTMVLWNALSGAPITFWAAPAEVLDVALAPRARFALLGLGNYSAVLFDVQRGGVLQTVYHEDRVQAVALDESGRLALTGGEDGVAILWETSSGREVRRWQHEDEVVTVALSDDGSRALTVAKYDRAAVWNTADGALLWELPLKAAALRRGQSFTSAAFSASGRQLLTGTADEQVQLWDLLEQQELARWVLPKRDTLKPSGAPVLALAFGAGGDYFAVASTGLAHRLTRRAAR